MPRSRSPLAPFHPIVRQWFRDTLGAPSAPQRDGWPSIAGGNHTLILAPTGSGKTLAAFLWELNQLIVDGAQAPLANAVHILYVSPLKALNNDVQRNLEQPLAQLRERFAAVGEALPDIQVAVRTGDTPASARARMIRRSPHILITTPESLHIMLTTGRGRGMFSGVRAVVVDEIHAIAGTKRGAHLALTLERLEELCERPPQRIGLSATQRPLDEIARFLAGTGRDCRIVDCGLVKRMETTIESPVPDLGKIGGTVWPAVTALTLRHIRAAKTALVFVNNRGQSERMAARLNALAGEEIALPYHGALSRDRRLAIEQSLKNGGVRALVSTSALELGIDIGSIDLVVQIQSPKRVSNALQRVGRAGHSLDAISRGVMIPTFRDDAMEMLAIGRAMRSGDVEPTRVVQNALDVLAQVIVAIAAVSDALTSDALFALVRRAYPYHALSRGAFDEVLDMLAGKYPSDVSAELTPRIAWDRVNDVITPARSARMVAVISGGTIPDRGLYTVNLPDRTRLGELDEEFVHESRVGDVFQLGSSTWRVQTIEHDRVVVTPAPGAPARMPFWHGEFGARSPHLASAVGDLRRALESARTPDDVATIAAEYACDESVVATLAEYVGEQRAATGLVPDERVLCIEQFRDETDALRIVVHSPFGGRIHAPWGMALANRVREWLANRTPAGSPASGSPMFEIQVQTTDDGIMLRLPSVGAWIPAAVIRDLTPDEAERRVLDEIGSSSLFGARFRMNAARALLLPRGNPRRRMPLWLQRLKALDLLQTVREFPSFPILVETYRDVLQDAFDMSALGRVLRDVNAGSITMHPTERSGPSPFAVSLQVGFVVDWLYADDAPRAEQRAAMLSLDRSLLDEVMGSAGGPDDETMAMLETMVARRRANAVGTDDPTAPPREVLARFLSLNGPISVDDVVVRYALNREWVEQQLTDWVRSEKLVRGTFGGSVMRWCSRRLLEHARRRVLAQARKQIEAVDFSVFARFLQKWQHVDPSTRLGGDEGAATIVRQMSGLARPAREWERAYFPARLDPYDRGTVTRLLAAGEVVWVGGSSAPGDAPTELATARFVTRGTGRAWLDDAATSSLSDEGTRVRSALETHGASFFDDLLDVTALSARKLRDALRELVTAGLVTNDTMESLALVSRWRPFVSPGVRAQPDPTRWLPADFEPSPGRPIVQRRPNIRRMPRWHRPDRPDHRDAAAENWPGRWSLVHTRRVMGGGAEAEEGAWATLIARQWLDRYGIVSREIWRRERPAISWRAIYREFRRLEFRGDVRRGYFVRGLSGAQFALADSVERLREPASANAPPIVVASSDPSNPYPLPLLPEARDPFLRSHSRSSLLVTIRGVVVMISARRASRVTVRAGVEPADVARAAGALAAHVVGQYKRDLIVETIDGAAAALSPHSAAFLEGGFRRGSAGLRYYV